MRLANLDLARVWKQLVCFLEVTSKPIFGVILNQPRELKLGKNYPPFLKGGRGD